MNKEYGKIGEIRNGQGQVVWSLWIRPELMNRFEVEDNPQGNNPDNSQEENAWAREESEAPKDPMTSAQKRYLFRLLAEKGIEGDEAYRHLRQTFGVNNLKDVGKYEASQAIDRMLQGA